MGSSYERGEYKFVVQDDGRLEIRKGHVKIILPPYEASVIASLLRN